jgi:hypothetical protein
VISRDLLTNETLDELERITELLRAEVYRGGASVEWDKAEPVVTKIDWHALEKVARRQTPRERLAALTSGRHRVHILVGTAAFAPVVIVLAHEWATGALRGAGVSEILMVIAVLLAVASMATLFVGAAIAELFHRKSTRRPWLSHELCLCLCGIWVALLTGAMYWSARMSTMLTPGRALVFVASPELGRDKDTDASVAVQDGMALYLGRNHAEWRHVYPEVAKALKSNNTAATPILSMPEAAQVMWMASPELRQSTWSTLVERSPAVVARTRLKMMRSWLESMNNIENAAAVHGALAGLSEPALTVYDANRNSVRPTAKDYGVLRARVELEVRLLVQEALGSLSGWKGCPPSSDLAHLAPSLESTIAGGTGFVYDARAHELRLNGSDARPLGKVDLDALEDALQQSCNAARPLRASRKQVSEGSTRAPDGNPGED